MARNHHHEEDEFGDDEIAEETQELMQIIFGDPEEWNDVIETAPKQMRQACRVAKDKAAALRRYCIEAGLLRLPVRTKSGKSRHTLPRDVNRKRRSLETSLQKLFAKGRANGAGVEEFVWGISYGDGSIRIGSDEVLAPIWQNEGYMEKVRQQANTSKLTAQQFKDSLRSADIATLLSKHLSVPERKAAVTSLGPVCSPSMAVTSFTAAFGAASGRLAWWPPAVPLSKAWKLKADETIVVLEAMAQNIVTHFGAGTTLSEEEQKRGCLEVFKRCVVGPHVAAGLKGSDSRKVAIFELIGEKAVMMWQLPATSGQGQEGGDSGAPSQSPAPRRVRRTKAQMGPQPFPCPRCVGEYSTAAALKAHRCRARAGAQPCTNSQTAAPAATAQGAHRTGGTVPPSNGWEQEHWDDAPDGAMDELIEEVEKDAAQGTTEAREAVRPQVAATEFLHSVQHFAAPYEQDSNAPSHLLQLLGDLLDQGDVSRKVLHVLHTMQGVGTVSTRLHKAGLDVAVPTDTLLVEAHTETVVRHLRVGSGNWPRFIEECELLEDLAENMGGELAERWSCLQRVILDPSVASEVVDKFNRDAVFALLTAFVDRAKLALRNLDKAPNESGHGNVKERQLPPGADAAQEHEHGRRQDDGPPRAQAGAGQRDGGRSAQPGSGQRDATLNPHSGGGQSDVATAGQPRGGRCDDEQSARSRADQRDAAPNAQRGGGQRPGAPSAQSDGGQGPGGPSAQSEGGRDLGRRVRSLMGGRDPGRRVRKLGGRRDPGRRVRSLGRGRGQWRRVRSLGRGRDPGRRVRNLEKTSETQRRVRSLEGGSGTRRRVRSPGGSEEMARRVRTRERTSEIRRQVRNQGGGSAVRHLKCNRGTAST
ncbi:hypothetical protein KFL_010960030 [Klebsormidium nitens]|uniref:Uncharacterized protein n=1 Tax=Klebsormidium nitens TaxID=105231 RepID=A0A1Y1IRM8_KLENI|nr:hypothetical protein KFL_010960030 [Klebsormidium nitens]|eukprot:GAQ92692.1 hypothetical protein KFL_010960030 [Klebsormidium nitens]